MNSTDHEHSIGHEAGPSSAIEPCEFLIFARPYDYERLLETHEATLGEGRVEQFLFDECAKVFAEVRRTTGIIYDKLVATCKESHFTLGSPDCADVFCQRLIESFEQRNAKIPNADFHLRMLLGITEYAGEAREREGDSRLLHNAAALADAGKPGEICMASQVWNRLSAERRESYGREEELAASADGIVRRFHRKRVISIESTRREKCVMNVDMSQFSKIQRHYQVNFGAQGTALLQNQIQKIMSDGFDEVGCDYQRACQEFGGDGGMFILDSAEEAHQIAMQILQFAEKQNEKGRKEKVDDALRCFRIGIACGEVSHDRQNKLASEAISTAKRLESGGCTGEIRISPEAYRRLPESLRRLYGGEEPIHGKEHDGIAGTLPGHRLAATPAAPWEKPAPRPVENREFAKPATVFICKEECFVISPIDDHDLRIAEVFDRLIVPACHRAGFHPKRADQIVGPDRMQVITGMLSAAPMTVAYLGRPTPHWNPDVMLEVGYRFATRLPVVMISEAPLPGGDGRIASFKELLPFHLVQKTIVTVSEDPQESVHRLAAEIKAVRNEKPRSEWKTAHPIIEWRAANIQTDLTVTEISSECRAMFGVDQTWDKHDLEGLRKTFHPRVEDAQLKAFRREQMQILRRIQDEALGLEAEDGRCRMPIARVPLVFKDEPTGPEGKPTGHLPIIIRYSIRQGVMQLRVLYLTVSDSLRQDPAGHWVCDL